MTYSGNMVKQYGIYSASTGGIGSTASGISDSISRSIGSSKGDGNKSQYELEREQLLSAKIKGAYVGWCPLDNRMPGIGFKISQALTPLKAGFIPGNLGGGIYFYHATIWVSDGGFWNGICIEYGMYDDDGTDEYPTPVHYWKKNGLRFGKVNFYVWKENILHMTYNYGNKGDYVETEINNQISVEELLKECCKYNPFQSSNYAATSNNCQDFVDKCIRILKLKRKGGGRGFHTLSKSNIPNQILTAFEAVENDWEVYVGKIPIAGVLFDSAHYLKRQIFG